MPELLKTRTSRARKEHTCDYCGEKIHAGETYCCDTFKGDYIYEWKMHLGCQKIADEFFASDYAGDADGMSQDSFMDACNDFCYMYICPECESYKMGECGKGKSYCLDKMAAKFETHDLVQYRDWDRRRRWKLKEKTGNESGGKEDVD